VLAARLDAEADRELVAGASWNRRRGQDLIVPRVGVELAHSFANSVISAFQATPVFLRKRRNLP
jgi:hypothetical protein